MAPDIANIGINPQLREDVEIAEKTRRVEVEARRVEVLRTALSYATEEWSQLFRERLPFNEIFHNADPSKIIEHVEGFLTDLERIGLCGMDLIRFPNNNQYLLALFEVNKEDVNNLKSGVVYVDGLGKEDAYTVCVDGIMDKTAEAGEPFMNPLSKKIYVPAIIELNAEELNRLDKMFSLELIEV